MKFASICVLCLLALSLPANAQELPNPFVLDNGSPITVFSQWEQRRGEMIAHLLDNEYGHQPPLPSTYIIENEQIEEVDFPGYDVTGIKYTAYMRFGPQYELKMKIGYWRPAHLSGALPTILAMEPVWWSDPFLIHDIVPRLLQRGVVFAGFLHDRHPVDCPEDNCGLASYEDPSYQPVKRIYPGYDWGVIAIGAWGYRLAMNYFEDVPYINSHQVAIWGHSRRAKSCLLAGALDDRFKMVVPHMSGTAGSATYRVRNNGAESLGHLCKHFPHWPEAGFCDHYTDVNQWPFDQHFLHSLIAPRHLYMHVGSYDYPGNPMGEEAAYHAAVEVYRYYDVESHVGLYFGPYDHINPGTTWDSWETLLQWMELHFKGIAPTKNFRGVKYGEGIKNFSWKNPLATPNDFVWNFWNWHASHQVWDKPLGVGDVNNDGTDDVIIINGTGFIRSVNLTGGVIDHDHYLGNPKRKWNFGLSSQQTWDRPLGVGDINGDEVDDIISIDGHGNIYGIVLADGAVSHVVFMGNPKRRWGWALTSQQTWDKPLGVGDINGDGFDDILIINGGGDIHAIIVVNGNISHAVYMGNPHNQWGWALASQQTWDKPLGVGDVNNDSFDDIVIINGIGGIRAIMVNAGKIVQHAYLGNPKSQWNWGLSSQQSWDKPIGVGDINDDGFADILIINGNGDISGVLIQNGAINRAIHVGNPHGLWNWALTS